MYAYFTAFVSVVLRVIPHLPNFSPMGASAVIAGRSLSFRKAVLLTLGQLFLVNMLLTLFYGFPFWMPSYAYVVLGFLFQIVLARLTKNMRGGAFLSIGLGSLLFFLVSNLGVWMEGTMYSRDVSGLMQAYLNALPFFKNSLLGDAVWMTVFSALPLVATSLKPYIHATPLSVKAA